ncbi:sugar phosphate isomerase/epimerase family protein [Moorella naiadis]|uniref:sugar phosphate isomerase/epimerase family protein n=1 Tax=Moorella naiadis (nom. illeg.) TaxID=3093670 RepID=UPI003D9C7EF5
MSIKIGCTAWSLTPTYNPPFDDAIDTIAELGFQGVELIVTNRQEMDEYYTPAQCARLAKQVASHNMRVSEFVVYAHMIEGLASLDKAKRATALADFEHGAKIAKALGSEIINTVSHWIPGLTAPIPYPPGYVYVTVPGVQRFQPKLTFKYPDFDWEQIWNNYVESMRLCAEIAAHYGLRFALEGHPHVIVSHTDSFLRLFEHAKNDNLGMNFDTGMQADQREYIPISIKKLGNKIFHMHVRDSDSLVTHQLPIGQGVLDWYAILGALKQVGYHGFLSIELGSYTDPVRWLVESKNYLERVLTELA